MSEPTPQFAPIVIFAYNRPSHLRQTVEALLKNKEAARSDLFIFSDGPKDSQAVELVEQVREYSKSITGFKSLSIIERPNNYGLAKSIIEGVTTICRQFNRVIVLEDDLVTSPFFLKFMNDGLNIYESEEQVASIHGYFYPVEQELPKVFFLRGSDCLGWAAWKRSWDLFESNGQALLDELHRLGLTEQFDYQGAYPFTQMLKDQIARKNDSWAIRWYASTFLSNKLTLYSRESLVKHTGNDGSGTNFGVSDILDTDVADRPIAVDPIPLVESPEARSAMTQYFVANKAPLLRRTLSRIKCAGKKWLHK